MRRGIVFLLVLCLIAAAGLTFRRWMPVPVLQAIGLRADISEIRTRQTQLLKQALGAKDLEFGAPVFLRIFKEEAELELHFRRGVRYELFRTYPICNFSGTLGPKLREGDRQSPEGIYQVELSALNPNSGYHLSLNLGFPNAYDRAHDRTGSFLMVHGSCVSIGCYAMTNPAIEEIYVLVEAALRGGQKSVTVHAFPFRPTPTRLARTEGSEWPEFWTDLAQYHSVFERTGNPPPMRIVVGRYVARGFLSTL